MASLGLRALPTLALGQSLCVSLQPRAGDVSPALDTVDTSACACLPVCQATLAYQKQWSQILLEETIKCVRNSSF